MVGGGGRVGGWWCAVAPLSREAQIGKELADTGALKGP